MMDSDDEEDPADTTVVQVDDTGQGPNMSQDWFPNTGTAQNDNAPQVDQNVGGAGLPLNVDNLVPVQNPQHDLMALVNAALDNQGDYSVTQGTQQQQIDPPFQIHTVDEIFHQQLQAAREQAEHWRQQHANAAQKATRIEYEKFESLREAERKYQEQIQRQRERLDEARAEMQQLQYELQQEVERKAAEVRQQKALVVLKQQQAETAALQQQQELELIRQQQAAELIRQQQAAALQQQQALAALRQQQADEAALRQQHAEQAVRQQQQTAAQAAVPVPAPRTPRATTPPAVAARPVSSPVPPPIKEEVRTELMTLRQLMSDAYQENDKALLLYSFQAI